MGCWLRSQLLAPALGLRGKRRRQRDPGESYRLRKRCSRDVPQDRELITVDLTDPIRDLCEENPKDPDCLEIDEDDEEDDEDNGDDEDD